MIIQGCVPAASNLNNKSLVKGICLHRDKDGKVANIPVDSQLKNDLAYTTDGAWIGCETAYTKRPINIFRLKPGQTCADIDQSSNATSDLFPIAEKVKVVRSNVAYETAADGKTQVASCERIAITQVTVNGNKGCAATTDLTCDSPYPGVSTQSALKGSSILSNYVKPVTISQCVNKDSPDFKRTCSPGYTLRQVTDSPRGIYWSPASMIGVAVSKDFPAPCLEEGEPPTGLLDIMAKAQIGILGVATLAIAAGKKNVAGQFTHPISRTLLIGAASAGLLLATDVISANVAKGTLQSVKAGACVCANDTNKEVALFNPLLTIQNIIKSPNHSGTQAYKAIEGLLTANGKRCYLSAEDILTPVVN